MAGRIRSIKPETLEDEEAAGLSDGAWRLWVSLWTLADDYGNCRASAAWLAGQIWWVSRKPAAEVEELISETVTARRIELYTVRGERYLHIRNWDKHQRIDNAGKNRVPKQDEANSSANLGEPRRTSANRRSDLRPPIPTSDPDLDPEVVCQQAPSALPTPLPFKPDEAIRALVESSKGRFVGTRLKQGAAIHVTKLIRTYPTLEVWREVGEWLAAGGDAWRQSIDPRALGDFDAWVAHASAWVKAGRGPISRNGNGAARAGPKKKTNFAEPMEHALETREEKI